MDFEQLTDKQKKELNITYVCESTLTMRHGNSKKIELMKYANGDIEFEMSDYSDSITCMPNKAQVEFLAKWLIHQTDVSGSLAIGKCVKVLHSFQGHEFEIGETVLVVSKSDFGNGWLCRNSNGVEWYLYDEECEIVNCR